MSQLIDDLLAFSRLGKKKISISSVNMNELTEGAIYEISKSVKHDAQFIIGELPVIEGDYGLLNQLMINLILNAVKYSSKEETSIVEIFAEETKDEFVFSVKDNGAGFDMRFVDKLFGVFQRLHSQEEFEGTGVGLAIVQRVIKKHDGRVWAEGKVGEGATFSFSISKTSEIG